jgi:ribosomal protein S28E/S33
MRIAMDGQILLASLLAEADSVAHGIIENLSASPRQGIQTRRLQTGEKFDYGYSTEFSNVFDLNSGQGLDVQLRVGFLDRAKQRLIMRDIPLRVQTTDRVHLIDPIRERFDSVQIALDVEGIGILGSGSSPEGTETTGESADIRLVHMQIAVEEYIRSEPGVFGRIRKYRDGGQIGMIPQHHTLFRRQ